MCWRTFGCLGSPTAISSNGNGSLKANGVAEAADAVIETTTKSAAAAEEANLSNGNTAKSFKLKIFVGYDPREDLTYETALRWMASSRRIIRGRTGLPWCFTIAGTPKNRILTSELVNSQTGAFLHRFMWLDDNEIGSIPFVWNFLIGHNQVDENDPSTAPKAIHYTAGGPWFEAWKNCDFADLWVKEMQEYKQDKEGVSLKKMVIH
ncbi:protein CDI isoform X2 [Cinnamomum micranthum f. kanehirae]|uniref:Protein CDI isoform X2 n=1 Tax=Cinnamomum micranthum f. kanehirae TaxID=337451 RepID=A0A443NNC0_9MAGN|nr:protein CDI isoform X2 [Cinnamomum micranthum f. kanehirae]